MDSVITGECKWLKKMVCKIEEGLSFDVNRVAAASISDYDHRRKLPLNSFIMSRYFTLRWLLFMALFTAALLLLPLVLPPLPPPPLLTLLFVPVAILAMLIFMAFTPPQLPNVAFNSI